MSITLKVRDSIPLTLFATENPFTTKTRLQKLVFLTVTETQSTLSFDFYPYDYGPFSKQLLNDINRFEEHDLITTQTATSSVSYELTEEGQEALDTLRTERDACEANHEYTLTIYDEYGDHRVRTLLDYIYKEYDEYVYASPYS